MTGGEMTPFRWVVSQDEIDDLYARLDKTRWPQQLKSPANDDWLYGTELGYLQELSWYWRNAFDIQRHVAKFNRMPQFTTEVRGRRLHFVHRPCARAGAPALLLAHGWPGSVFEFYKMVEPLAEDFHVVAPSIPGYAWSAPPEHRGHTYVETARDYHILMLKLGYTKYNVHGGDWGSLIVKSMAVLYPRNVLALHTTMPIGLPPPAGVTDPPLTRDELVGLQRTVDFRKFGAAYQQIQGSKPQTLAYGLTDSPVGLLGWIVEKMRSWTDNDGDPTTAVTKDEILTNVMVYWCSQCIGPSIRYYMENGTGPSGIPGLSTEPKQIREQKSTVPVAIAEFPHEIFHPTSAMISRAYTVKKHTRFERGGHFPGWEAADVLVQDIRAAFLESIPSKL